MSFTVKTTTFEGPLDLLLDLIEKKKLFINEISLAKITDDFIDHIKRFEQLPMGESAHFILVASTLLLIKSRSLLPGLHLTEEEEDDIRDLEVRLKVYECIRGVSVHVRELFGDRIIFPQSHGRVLKPVFTPPALFTLEHALSTLDDLISRLPKKESLPHKTVQKVISLEDMITTLASRITRHLRVNFSDFAREHKVNRVNVIVGFLAMLELVKQGVMQVTQRSHFDDIVMETKDVGVPRY